MILFHQRSHSYLVTILMHSAVWIGQCYMVYIIQVVIMVIAGVTINDQHHGICDNQILTRYDHVLLSLLYFIKSEFNTTVTVIMS